VTYPKPRQVLDFGDVQDSEKGERGIKKEEKKFG
jgi:hypothetical protein